MNTLLVMHVILIYLVDESFFLFMVYLKQNENAG